MFSFYITVYLYYINILIYIILIHTITAITTSFELTDYLYNMLTKIPGSFEVQLNWTLSAMVCSTKSSIPFLNASKYLSDFVARYNQREDQVSSS